MPYAPFLILRREPKASLEGHTTEVQTKACIDVVRPSRLRFAPHLRMREVGAGMELGGRTGA